jgi:hypothetical protein
MKIYQFIAHIEIYIFLSIWVELILYSAVQSMNPTQILRVYGDASFGIHILFVKNIN